VKQTGQDKTVRECIRHLHLSRQQYFKVSADQGNSGSPLDIGLAFLRGEGVDQDLAEAGRCFKMPTDQGNAEGQLCSDVALRARERLHKDLAEAERYFRIFADQGDRQAQKIPSKADVICQSPAFKDIGKTPCLLPSLSVVIPSTSTRLESWWRSHSGKTLSPGSISLDRNISMTIYQKWHDL
jgi:hypothetical protein